MSAAVHPKLNHLLAALPEAQWRRWEPLLEPVETPLGQVLYESGATLSHVYFPADSIVSLLYVMENGASAEIAVVGNEGLLGISLYMGGESTPSRAVVQSAGRGFRLAAHAVKHEFETAGPVMRPARAGAAQLRVLCRREEGIRPVAARQAGPLRAPPGRRHTSSAPRATKGPLRGPWG